MEKHFSLESIISGTKRTIKRFPLPLVVAFLATVVALNLFDNEPSSVLIKLLLTLVLMFPLSVAATSLSEHYSTKGKVALLSAVSFFAVVYHFFIAKDFFQHEQFNDYIQYALWFLASVSLATFLPFLKQQVIKSVDFWFYSQRIVYAFLATFIYSAVLFIGLTIAMTSFAFLFDVALSVQPFQLWIVVVGIFCPLFFLSRYPSMQDDSQTVYPNELKKFSSYILAPLVALYFIILYSYTIKILVSWEWPKGIISSMILGFSILGVLTYTILYPLVVKDERLQKVAKVFFGVLLPQIAVLFWAIWVRVADYGVTENRYLLIAFGFWLLGLSLYFLLAKRKNISVIPTSLFVILLVISFGPWSMFSVSERSQISRLEKILVKNDMFIDGKAVKASKEVSYDDSKEITNIVTYLRKTDALTKIQPWFTEDLRTSEVSVTSMLGIQVQEKEMLPRDELSLTADMGDYYSFDVRGYDYIAMKGGQSVDTVVGGNTYRFELNREDLNYLVYKNGNEIVRFSKKDYFSNLVKKYGGKSLKIKAEELSFTYEDSNIKMKVCFEFMYGSMPTVYVNQVVLFSVK